MLCLTVSVHQTAYSTET